MGSRIRAAYEKRLADGREVDVDAAHLTRERCPLDRLLVETDAPYLTPHPYRGRPNGPYLLPYTVRTVAEVLGHDLEEVCAAVTANALRVFTPW